MSLTAKQIVEARAPQYAGADRLQDYLAIAEEQTSTTAFGTSRPLAVALLCLHMMETDRRNTPGPVTSRSEGELSIGYGSSGESGDLASTHWGLQLQTLRRVSGLGARNRMMV